MVLSIAYFPPVEYFAVLARYSAVYIEACENYQKQSYRNRCRIYSASGPQDLNFPICHENGSFALPIQQIKVDYSTPWLLKTKRCFDAAYRSSAFFDYYRDELYALLDTKPETLWELDLSIIRFFLRKIGLATEILPTSEFTSQALDIHPKRTNTILADSGLNQEYYQVFSQKHGFIPNLSILDLLANEGPAALDYLR